MMWAASYAIDSSVWESHWQTFAGAEFESNWRALFATIELVRQVGHILADSLGFEYPDETDRRVTDYIRWVRSTNHL